MPFQKKIMKHLEAIGRYFIMIYEVFRKRTKWAMTKKLIMKDIDDLMFGSLGIIAFISLFVGVVIAIQMALNIDNPLIPKNLIGFATRQTIVLKFAPTFTSIKDLWYTILNCQHIETKVGLHLGHLEEIVEDNICRGIAFH